MKPPTWLPAMAVSKTVAIPSPNLDEMLELHVVERVEIEGVHRAVYFGGVCLWRGLERHLEPPAWQQRAVERLWAMLERISAWGAANDDQEATCWLARAGD